LLFVRLVVTTVATLCFQTFRPLAQVSIPDKTAAELLGGQPGGLLSMCAGDFVEVRRHD